MITICGMLSRRDLLKSSAAGAAAWLMPASVARADDGEKYLTCFYQFNTEAVHRLSVDGALPNGEKFLHIFTHSSPGMRAHPEQAKTVHDAGQSYKYATAYDAHKLKGWQQASDDELREHAIQYRQLALESNSDYFCFNEMPTTGAEKPALRDRVTKMIRWLHEAGGGPKMRGIFYFTEKNLEPPNWQGDSDDFWATLDETCDVVVGEHYHSAEFVFAHTAEKYADHLFSIAKWLMDSNKQPQQNIAQHKYAVLHSSYFGAQKLGWAGLLNDRYTADELEQYFNRCIAATRLSEFGRHRISFAPISLAQEEQLSAVMIRRLTRALAGDARRYADIHGIAI